MKQQKGYIFHKGKSWFVRYCDDVMQSDGTIKRKLVCKKLPVDYGGEYRTKASVKPFAQEILAPVNRGALNAQSTMRVSDFIEKIYLPHVNETLRAATLKGYSDIWENHLKSRMAKANLTLRAFRTVHGEVMLAQIAKKTGLGRSSLKNLKAFLSGAFKQAKRLGILDGINPMMDVSIPRAPEPKDTYAYSLEEIRKMLLVLDEPAKTVVLTAALTGLRKGEIRGLAWDDFDGRELSVRRSVWSGRGGTVVNEPKTKRSKAPIPVVKQLRDALEAHRQRMGKLAAGPIFQASNGKPLDLNNLVRRAIQPALALDPGLPRWHGWHAFRRGLATNLHQLGVDDKTIQAIMRHSNIGVTMNIYVKSVAESQVAAMDTLGEKLGTCNDLATDPKGPVN